MSSDLNVKYATMGAIRLAYTTAGGENAPPVLLIAGLGGQLISWDDGFCDELVDRGLRVIRFDNRDGGLSTHLGDHASADPSPSPVGRSEPAGSAAVGMAEPVYSLEDMAADVAGLIEHLGIGSAHVVGASLGGMVAQILAIQHRQRVRSLTSIMSTTGDPTVGEPADEAIALLIGPRPTTRQAVLDQAVLNYHITGSPAYPVADDELRRRAGRAFDRAFDPGGFRRQLLAALHTPDRTAQLRELSLPSLVIHGADDTLIGVSGGRATAAAIPDAELLVLDGMGHDLPRALWPQVGDHIAALVHRVEHGS